MLAKQAKRISVNRQDVAIGSLEAFDGIGACVPALKFHPMVRHHGLRIKATVEVKVIADPHEIQVGSGRDIVQDHSVATAADLNLMRVGNDLYLYSRFDTHEIQ